MTGVENLRRASIVAMCVIGAYGLFMMFWGYGIKMAEINGADVTYETSGWRVHECYVLPEAIGITLFVIFMLALVFVLLTPRRRKGAE